MKCPVKGLSRDLGKKFRNLCKNKWPGSISKVQEYYLINNISYITTEENYEFYLSEQQKANRTYFY